VPRLLIATTNSAKMAEYKLLLANIGLEPVSLADLKIAEAPVEHGLSFVENALLKARFYFDHAAIPTLADDGGLEVDALGGEPGVRSHRWLGAGASDQALAAEVIRRMAAVPPELRTARLRAAAALVWRDTQALQEHVVEAAIEGRIADRLYPSVKPGFPYRAIFVLPGDGRYLAELDEAEAAALSQRRANIELLRETLTRIAASDYDVG
jgi:XTP/dITP diphosphohydrolase